MPSVPFVNEQTVHVAHSRGNTQFPVTVVAEGFQRLVEIQYGDGFFDVLFGRVMATGLISYEGGVGAGATVFLLTRGAAGAVSSGTINNIVEG